MIGVSSVKPAVLGAYKTIPSVTATAAIPAAHYAVSVSSLSVIGTIPANAMMFPSGGYAMFASGGYAVHIV